VTGRTAGTAGSALVGVFLFVMLFVGPCETTSDRDVDHLRHAYVRLTRACEPGIGEPRKSDVDVVIEALKRSPDQRLPLLGAGQIATPAEVAARAINELQNPQVLGPTPRARPATGPCAVRSRELANRLRERIDQPD